MLASQGDLDLLVSVSNILLTDLNRIEDICELIDLLSKRPRRLVDGPC